MLAQIHNVAHYLGTAVYVKVILVAQRRAVLAPPSLGLVGTVPLCFA